MTPPLATRPRLAAALIAAAAGLLFLVLAWPGAAERGILGEEVQPFLRRHPVVLEWAAGRVAPMPPHEPGAPAPPRWVKTSQWPVIAYDGDHRMWPVFIRGHQTALGSYPGILFGRAFGGGIAGPRRVTVLLGALIVIATALLALRTNERRSAAAWAGVAAAASFGMISIARTAESFEVGSRAAMMIALLALAPRGPPTARRALIAGLAGAVAVLCRGTILVALLPAMAVLLWRKDCRPRPRTAVAIGLMTMALPAVLVALFSAFVPFREGSAPLSGFPLASVPTRLLAIPRQSLLSLAWLGDATSIWKPLLHGEMAIDRTLPVPAFLAAIPLLAAAYRLYHGRAGTGEKLYLATFAASAAAGAALYSGPHQFQLALAVEPMIALALADQLASLAPSRIAWVAGATLLVARGHSAGAGLLLDHTNRNPMFSGLAQRGAIERLRALGARGPDIMTTVYNQAGVIEGWTGGIDAERPEIRPVHAWPVLAAARRDQGDCSAQAAWRALLSAHAPRYIVLTEGTNLFESSDTDPAVLARGLSRAAAAAGLTLTDEGHFPTESGGPGWAIQRIDYPPALLAAGPGRALAADPACPAETAFRSAPRELPRFHGLTPGARAGAFIIERIEQTEDGAHVIARSPAGEASFDIRPLIPGAPEPPAIRAGLGVFYRTDHTGRIPGEELVRTSVAIAEQLTD